MKTKTDPISGITYRIPTPEQAEKLRKEGRELRRLLEIQLRPMTQFEPEFWLQRVK